MTKVSEVLAAARAAQVAACNAAGSPNRGASVSAGVVSVYVVPVQPRGMSAKWGSRADVYMNGKKMKKAEVEALLKAEA